MPLLVGSPTASAPIVAPPTSAAAPITLTWTAPDGGVWPLTADPDDILSVQNALAGFLGAAPIAITTDPNPFGGVTVRRIQPVQRYGTLPLRVASDDPATLAERWEQTAWAFAQTRLLGPGTLTVWRANRPGRSIQAYYQAGFDGTPGAGLYHDDAILTLLCPDPFWRDLASTVVSRRFQGSSSSFFSPFLSVSSAQTLGDTTIDNPGHEIAWPRWTIVGPASGITATHQDTGEEWVLDPTWDSGPALTADDTVVITTRPPTVRGPDGSVWTGALNWPSAVLWGLRPGANNVTFTVAGSGAGTSITLEFTPGYETP